MMDENVLYLIHWVFCELSSRPHSCNRAYSGIVSQLEDQMPGFWNEFDSIADLRRSEISLSEEPKCVDNGHTFLGAFAYNSVAA